MSFLERRPWKALSSGAVVASCSILILFTQKRVQRGIVADIVAVGNDGNVFVGLESHVGLCWIKSLILQLLNELYVGWELVLLGVFFKVFHSVGLCPGTHARQFVHRPIQFLWSEEHELSVSHLLIYKEKFMEECSSFTEELLDELAHFFWLHNTLNRLILYLPFLSWFL